MIVTMIINACCKPNIFLRTYWNLKKIALISTLFQKSMINNFYIFFCFKTGGFVLKILNVMVLLWQSESSSLPACEIYPTSYPTPLILPTLWRYIVLSICFISKLSNETLPNETIKITALTDRHLLDPR